ncbi:MAG TPA: hydantoinase/oxoprolinase family protein [Hyphomicrobiaceae bacterium]|nr:hydantoinase/oxoprolinase family protein [Hyphomicrobiaceae bacterium]
MGAGALRLAVDVGGTFTDVVLEASDKGAATKVLTTPDAPERAILEGARHVLAELGRSFADIDVLIHGTTLATNAIIERKGARVALLTTEGFRDVIEIADESRFDQYDLMIEKPKPLVPRRLRFGVPERLDVTGKVRLALDERRLEAIVASLAAERIEAVAVAYLHSYVSAIHEERTRDVLAKRLPGLSVTLSSEVCPEMREWERTSTAVANAYVQPLMSGYLGRLERSLAEAGYRRPIHLITSGGSLTSLETAQRFPVRLVESGPAGGAILSAAIAAELGEKKVLSFDMGGTTAKVCLITDYEPMKARTFEVDRAARFLKGSGLPVRVPVIEMVEIGAGGGSIARVDTLRRITVGPDSAASVPGPACYGRGGTEATVTDADVVLGRIDVAGFAGGKLTLKPANAGTAVAASVGAPLGLSVEAAAHGIAEIVDENMSNAARVHAVERGVIIAEHTLIAFGGAAPLHAARMAEKLGIRRVVVPEGAGVGSAIGFLRAPAAYELVRSRFMRLGELDLVMANDLLGAMSREARGLAEAAALGRPLEEQRVAYMRYTGQGHEIAVPLPNRGIVAGDAAAIREAFEAGYRQLFERHIPGAEIEILSWSVLVSTPAGSPIPRSVPAAASRSAGALEATGTVQAYDQRQGRRLAIPTYRRDAIGDGQSVDGPALILEAGTSTFVSALFAARRGTGGALVLERKGG